MNGALNPQVEDLNLLQSVEIEWYNHPCRVIAFVEQCSIFSTMKYFIITLCFVFVGSELTAQKGSIRGNIFNQTDQARLSKVKVLVQRDTSSIDSIYTSENGTYQFLNLPMGNYSVVIRKQGFKELLIDYVGIQSNQTCVLNIGLVPGKNESSWSSISANNGQLHPDGLDSPNEASNLDELALFEFEHGAYLDAVEVVHYATPILAKDGSAGSSIARITRNNIAKMPGRSASSIAATVGGVTTDNEGEVISIRGSRANEVAYYVDGVKVIGSERIPKAAIHEINVITGGVPACYGDASGIISITTNGFNNRPPKPEQNWNSGSDTIDDLFGESVPFANTESYEIIYENDFLNPSHAALSTFSIDVDKASYSNVRRFLQTGTLPPKSAVRIEEMINYFSYDYPNSTSEKEPITVHTEYAKCPWNDAHGLLKIGMKGYEIPIEYQAPNNLVFLLDVSGSMDAANKLPLLQKGMELMVEHLDENDKVSIVVYAGASGLALPPTAGNEKAKIKAAINKLSAAGSTNGSAGIRLAYEIAEAHFIEGGNNRIILGTDGDFNVGNTSTESLEELIGRKRKTGVYLTTLGFGSGNYKDDRMELLADKGNGNYFYIDSEKEAVRVLSRDLFGVLFAIAKDVKIQVEFNPKQVQSYRLIGYENRLLKAQDFNNDAIDAGELGSGHTVTALYEIIPMNGTENQPSNQIDALRFQKTKPTKAGKADELALVKYRFKLPSADSSQKRTMIVRAEQVEQPTKDFEFCATVAAFGMNLRASHFSGNLRMEDLVLDRSQLPKDSDRREFYRLVALADDLNSGAK